MQAQLNQRPRGTLGFLHLSNTLKNKKLHFLNMRIINRYIAFFTHSISRLIDSLMGACTSVGSTPQV